ncbi:MAG TPA: hypothetical protein DD490_05780 [Acidobacteria bacterium]|nr:hypothetical protein [Acidobacteriota bacterium]
MVRNESAELQASASSEAKHAAYETPVLNPRSPIEVASAGGGTTGDPAASDNKPPGVADFDLFA